MSRLDAQAQALDGLRARWRREGALRELRLDPAPPDGGGTGAADVVPWPRWPRGRGLVLRADAALDLGPPQAGSLSFLLWSEGPRAAAEAALPGARASHRVAWRGPDIGTLVERGAAEAGLGLVIHVHVHVPPDPQDSATADRGEYERYLDLKDALYSLALQGATLRSMPSQQHLWLRLHRDAVAEGFSLAHLGAAVVEALAPVDGVSRVDVLLVSADAPALAELTPLAEAVHRRVAALVKRHEEELAECAECDYADVCEEREHGI